MKLKKDKGIDLLSIKMFIDGYWNERKVRKHKRLIKKANQRSWRNQIKEDTRKEIDDYEKSQGA